MSVAAYARRAPTRAASGGATRTPTSSRRRSSPSPTAWAARRPARSRRSSPPRRSRTTMPAARTATERVALADPGGEPPRLRALERPTPTVSGMGTTMTVALVEGDARRDRPRRRLARLPASATAALEQLTEDHSLVDELMQSGKLSPEEAETHPQRSVITRALGTDPDVDVDTFTVEAQQGDVFLLCSDGLTTMVDDDDDPRACSSGNRDDLERAAKALVAAANRGGGEDNITVVAFEIDGDDDDAGTRSAPEPRSRADSTTRTRWPRTVRRRSRPLPSRAGRRSAPSASGATRRSRVVLVAAARLWGLEATSSARSRTAASPSTRACPGRPASASTARLREPAAACSCSPSAALFDHACAAVVARRGRATSAVSPMSLGTASSLNLVVVGLLTAIGFASVYIARQSDDLDRRRSRTPPSSSPSTSPRTSSRASPCRTPTRTCCRWRRC